MKDVQNITDNRGIGIQNVGVSDVHLPFLIKTKAGSFQSVLAKINLTVNLPKEYKGTHMSRFVEVLQTMDKLSPDSLERMLDTLKDRLEAICREFLPHLPIGGNGACSIGKT